MQTSLKLRGRRRGARRDHPIPGRRPCRRRTAPPRVHCAGPTRRRLRPDLPPGHRGPEAERALKSAMRIVYMPGGIGAVAYNNIVAQHPNEPGTIVAFSGGSLLNGARQVRQVQRRRRALAGGHRHRLRRGRGAQRFAVHRPEGPDGSVQAGSDQDRAGRRHRRQPGLDESRADRQGGRCRFQEDALRGL